jgi:hypothetical protein
MRNGQWVATTRSTSLADLVTPSFFAWPEGHDSPAVTSLAIETGGS